MAKEQANINVHNLNAFFYDIASEQKQHIKLYDHFSF